MRTASIAKLSLTALVGLGSLIVSADLAEAGPGPQQGSIKVAPTTPTTAKPQQGGIKVAPTTPTTVTLPGDKVAIPTPTTIQPLPADEVAYCDLHLCVPADEVDPEPECKLNPVLCDNPANDKLDSPGCKWTHGCPGEGGGTGGGTGGTDGDEPCRSDLDARTSCEGDGGTDGQTDGGTDGEQGTDGQADGGTDGQADGGTTGGGGGRLPKTGGSLMALLGGGLGLTGVGAAIKRATRRRSR